MPKFSVSVWAPISVTIEVEVDSADQIEDVLWDLTPGSLCHQCERSHGEPGDWTIAAAYDENGNEVPVPGWTDRKDEG